MFTDSLSFRSALLHILVALLSIGARVFVIAGCVSLVGCGSGSGGSSATIVSVEITALSASLGFLGETTQLSAAGVDAGGNVIQFRNFAWSSSDANVATVSSTGLATAVGNGTAIISASTSGVSGSIAVVVEQLASQLEFAVEPVSTAAGSEIPVVVTIQDAAGIVLSDATEAVILSINDNPGGGTLMGTTVLSATAGVANFTGLSIDNGGVGYTLAAASGSLAGVTSSAFDIVNPVPVMAGISPTTVSAGGGNFTLTVDGNNFVPDSVVLVDAASRASMLISDTEMVATILAADIANAGTVAINVLNPQPGGGISNEFSLSVVNPVPNITSLTPSAAPVGVTSINMRVNGSAFVSGSVVRWDGSDLSTTFSSSSRLTATLTSAELAAVGSAEVTVFNPPPSGGVSSGVSFTIYRSETITTNDIIYNPVDGMIYASTPSTAGVIGNSIISIDPSTGDIGFSVFVGSEPNVLAVSDDGSTLYVGLDGSAQVRRFDIASQTAGIQFGTGDGGSGRLRFPEDIEVLPGSTDAVAVSMNFDSGSPVYAGVAIFDNGVARPTEVPGFSGTGSHICLIEFSASSSRLYGGSVEANPTRFTRLDVDVNGVSILDTTENIIPGAFGNREIVFDAGLIYTTQGGLIDPEARILLDTFQLPSSSSLPSVRPDSSAMQVHYLTRDASGLMPVITTFDDTTFLELWSLALEGISGTPSRLIRWGADGLAFRTEDQVVIVRHPLVGVR